MRDARMGPPSAAFYPGKIFGRFAVAQVPPWGRGSEAKPPTHSIPFFEYSSCRRHPLRVSSSRTAPLFGARHTDGHVGELLAEGADVPLAGVDVPQARAAAARPRAPGRLRADEGVGEREENRGTGFRHRRFAWNLRNKGQPVRLQDASWVGGVPLLETG